MHGSPPQTLGVLSIPVNASVMSPATARSSSAFSAGVRPGSWRRERMPRLPETAYFPLAPDWICEVLSPSTAALDRVKKLAVYAREGVLHAWLVDPIARTIEILRLEAGA